MNRKALFQALLCIGIWGLSFPFFKLILTKGVPPLLLVHLRFAIGALILLPWLKPLGDNKLKVFWLSLTLHSIPVTLTAVAVGKVDASLASLTTQLDVPFSWLLCVIFLKEKLINQQI